MPGTSSWMRCRRSAKLTVDFENTGLGPPVPAFGEITVPV